MVAAVDFKDAVVAFKVVAFEDAGLFKLGQHAVTVARSMSSSALSRICRRLLALRWRLSLSVVSCVP